MSADHRDFDRLRDVGERALDRVPAARIVALGGIVVVLGAFLSVLYEIAVVVGSPSQLYVIVAVSAGAGAVCSRLIEPRSALALGGGILLAGIYLYLRSLPGGVEFLFLVAPMLADFVELLGGVSVLRIVNADLWALSVAPVPVFLATYLGLRRRYVLASAVAGGGLGLLILTGDATIETTLVGVAGITVATVFGDCDRRGESLRKADVVAVVLAAMIVFTLGVGVVPGTTDSYVSADGIGGSEATMESSLVYADDTIAIQGEIQLSPFARYTVEADQPAYWRVSSYDRYTGDGWVRTDETEPYVGALSGPPGESERLEQTYTAESPVATLPSAWRPRTIEDVPVVVEVTSSGAFQPASPLEEGESYRTESRVPTASPDELREADESYPTAIEERYTQLPSSTPDRVGERTEQIAADADNPYDTARTIETWLKDEYEYSLDVERPDGDVADAFLFEMEAGYCTYYATTMVAMLRSQDIPARFVTGYATGERIDDDRWVVRGANSHAWVEVYFPGHGWIEFDPTPSGPRVDAEQARIEEAREEGLEGVDTEETRDEDDGAADGGSDTGGAAPETDTDFETEDVTSPEESTTTVGGGALPTIVLPTPREIGLGAIVLVGAIVGIRQTGFDRRIRREVWLRRVPRQDPEAAVVGAYRRLLYLREREGRRKQPHETPRQYLADADEPARRIGELYERVRYGDGVTEAEAAEAEAALATLLDRHSPLPHRLRSADEIERSSA